MHGSIKSGVVVWTVGIKARHLMHDVHKNLTDSVIMGNVRTESVTVPEKSRDRG